MESMTWIAVAMAAINMVDSIVTKFLTFFQKRQEEENRKLLALQQSVMEVKTGKIEVKTNQNASDIATARMETQSCKEAHDDCKRELAELKAEAAARAAAAKDVHEVINSRVSSVEQSVVAVAAAIPPTSIMAPKTPPETTKPC